MRLEYDVNFAISALLSRSQCGANFCGMMAVVVDHGDSCDLSANLESTVYASEIFQGLLDLWHGNIQSHSDRNRRGCVQYIVQAGHVQAKFAEVLVAKCY